VKREKKTKVTQRKSEVRKKKQNHMKGMRNEKRKEIEGMGAWNQCFKTLAPNPYTYRHVPYTYTLKTEHPLSQVFCHIPLSPKKPGLSSRPSSLTPRLAPNGSSKGLRIIKIPNMSW
jgi:hypothetical protein